MAGMARYDFRCKVCDERFEVSRPMSEASAPAACPTGHLDTVKLLPSLAMVGGASAGPVRDSSPAPRAGGCGTSCGCAH